MFREDTDLKNNQSPFIQRRSRIVRGVFCNFCIHLFRCTSRSLSPVIFFKVHNIYSIPDYFSDQLMSIRCKERSSDSDQLCSSQQENFPKGLKLYQPESVLDPSRAIKRKNRLSIECIKGY